MKKWHEKLFENYAKNYDYEIFVKGTIGEVDFIEKEINYNKSIKILDVGCGTGRHSIELAKRGYNVVGIDLSEAQLKRAKEKANEQGVKIIFKQCDACNMPFDKEFDLAICMCEGGFTLVENDDKDYEILKSVSKALKSGGKFILTTMNALYPITHPLQTPDDHASNVSFDLNTFREKGTIEITDDAGIKQIIEYDQRFYAPTELQWRLKELNFNKVETFGMTLGNPSREQKISVDDYEFLLIATK